MTDSNRTGSEATNKVKLDWQRPTTAWGWILLLPRCGLSATGLVLGGAGIMAYGWLERQLAALREARAAALWSSPPGDLSMWQILVGITALRAQRLCFDYLRLLAACRLIQLHDQRSRR